MRGLSRLMFSLFSVSESECVCVYTCTRSDDSLELQLYVLLGFFSFILLGYRPLRTCDNGLLEAASLVLLAVHLHRRGICWCVSNLVQWAPVQQRSVPCLCAIRYLWMSLPTPPAFRTGTVFHIPCRHVLPAYGPDGVPAPELEKGSWKAHANSKTWHKMSLGLSLFLERKSFDLLLRENNSTRKGRSFQEVRARVSFFLSLQALRHLFVGPLSYSCWHGLWLWCALPLLHTSSQR